MTTASRQAITAGEERSDLKVIRPDVTRYRWECSAGVVHHKAMQDMSGGDDEVSRDSTILIDEETGIKETILS